MKRTQVTTRSSASLLLMFCMLHPQPFLPRVLDADQGSRTLAELVEEYYNEYSRLNPLRASATGIVLTTNSQMTSARNIGRSRKRCVDSIFSASRSSNLHYCPPGRTS